MSLGNAGRLIDEMKSEERRSTRRKRPRLSLAELQQDGAPVRLIDLARLTGFSKDKFSRAIDLGELEATRVRACSRFIIVIERAEALRYLHEIRFAA
jgi:hypothetical protein